jgi:hypothetical protein
MMTGDTGADEMLRELAQRLLTHPHPEGPTSVELFLGRLPDTLALEFPLPPDARLLGSALHSQRGRPTQMQAVLDAGRDPQEVVAAYERQLADSGWNPFEGFGGMSGGFVPAGIGLGRSFRRGDHGPVLMVSVSGHELKPTDLRLRLDWEIIRHLPDMRRHGRPEGAERMPALHPPAGLPMRGGGGGGGGGTWQSQASIETDRPVGDLQSHFDQQLQRTGWKRIAGSADDVVAWSSWQLPGEGSWRGILIVLAAFGRNERALYLRIEASDAGNGGGGQVSSMSSG